MTEETSVSRRTRRTFTAEQKAEAVHLTRETGNISLVARDLDITRSSLVQWIERAKIDAGQGPEGALTTAERKELAALKRENRTLKMERDFLKKAAAFFAKENDPPIR
jgi:transposase